MPIPKVVLSKILSDSPNRRELALAFVQRSQLTTIEKEDYPPPSCAQATKADGTRWTLACFIDDNFFLTIFGLLGFVVMGVKWAIWAFTAIFG